MNAAGLEPGKRTPASGTSDDASVTSAFEVLKGFLLCRCFAQRQCLFSVHSAPQSCPFALMCFPPAETSEHQTLGGKDEWGKKKRSELRLDRYDRLIELDKEAGFFSAPWKFFKLGVSTKGDTDGADASGARLLPVKKCRLCGYCVACRETRRWRYGTHRHTQPCMCTSA